MFNEGLGKIATKDAPYRPDVIARQGSHAVEQAETMMLGGVARRNGRKHRRRGRRQRAPGVTIPMHGQGEVIIGVGIDVADCPDIVIRDGGNAFQAPIVVARVGRKKRLLVLAVPMFHQRPDDLGVGDDVAACEPDIAGREQ